jgi:nucleotide-binding universal stress UspA family protein
MPYQHVVTVYDGTPESDDLLDMVCRVARPYRARLTILHLKPVPLREPLPRYTPGEDADTDARVAKAEKLAASHRIEAASVVAYVRARGAAIAAQARICGADLVALLAPAADRTPSAESGLDPDIEFVLRRVACAVMLWRPARRQAQAALEE